jgi:hypothetical protein
MALDPIFTEISATTRADIRDAVVWNNFWVDTPLQDHLRRHGAVDPFTGGSSMQESFVYGGPDGGAVSPGQTITIKRKQILAATQFMPKAYASWFSVDDWEMSNGESRGVINAGPNAAVDIYQVYLEGLTSRLNTLTEMDWYRHGQASSANGNSAGVNDDRSLAINGVSEALNNGTDPSWDGNVFVNYGQQARNGAIANALNVIPQWFGTPNGQPGQIAHEILSQLYTTCINEPDFAITSKFGWTYIESMYQRQQQFNVLNVSKADIRWKGIQFGNAIIYADWLTPSAADPAFLPTGLVGSNGQTNQTGTITTGATPTAASRMPANATLTVGETFFFLSGSTWKSRPTEDKDWFFGIRRTSAYDNISLDALMMRLGINIYCGSPRDNAQGFGFNS